ncbi:MAG: hypothetical protein ACYDB7_10745 [Mycobacteriales bacterium]
MTPKVTGNAALAVPLGRIGPALTCGAPKGQEVAPAGAQYPSVRRKSGAA